MKKNVLFIWMMLMLVFAGSCSGENSVIDPLTDEEETTDTKVDFKTKTMNITIGDQVLTATLVENSSAAALVEALEKAPITIEMKDYGSMEKVGSLGRDFPRNDEQITTEAGDIILFQGSALVIYYAPNSWNFTRLGKIDKLNAEELKQVLGTGNVTVSLSLPEE